MYYVAYGSNLNVRQMEYRCPNAVPVFKGVIKDYKTVFKYHADIVPCKTKSDFAPCIIWDIRNKEEWHNLDRYEGYPKYYIRKEVDVICTDGKTRKAIAYIMNNKSNFILPDNHYFNCILEGYQDFGLNTELLTKALWETI